MAHFVDLTYLSENFPERNERWVVLKKSKKNISEIIPPLGRLLIYRITLGGLRKAYSR